MIIKKYHSYVVALFSVLMILIIANKAFYTHVHRLPDGTLIVHAHPYNKSQDEFPKKQHHHSGYEFLSLDNLNFFDRVTFFAYTHNYFIVSTEKIYFAENNNTFDKSLIVFNNKSPPVFGAFSTY